MIESRGVLEGILLSLIDGWLCWFEPIDVTWYLGFIILGVVVIGEEQWRGYSFGFVYNILKHGPGQGLI